AVATSRCSSQGLRDSIEPPNNCDTTADDYQSKAKAHRTNFELIEMQNLPGSRNHCGVQANHSDNQHSMLLCHRSAKLVGRPCDFSRSEEHTSELQSRGHLVCRLLLEKKKKY